MLRLRKKLMPLFGEEGIMPVHKVAGGYKWGSKGKVYPTKAQAERQGRAAYANGYKGKKR